MVEPNPQFKSSRNKLLHSQAIYNVVECFDIPELLDFREVNKKLGDDIIPKCFKTLRFYCPDDEEEEPKSFYSKLTNANKVEISNICGNETHLKFIQQIAENCGKNCRYLYLGFCGEVGNEALAA